MFSTLVDCSSSLQVSDCTLFICEEFVEQVSESDKREQGLLCHRTLIMVRLSRKEEGRGRKKEESHRIAKRGEEERSQNTGGG